MRCFLLSLQILCDTVCILDVVSLYLVPDDSFQKQRVLADLLCCCYGYSIGLPPSPSSSFSRQTRTVVGLLRCPLQSQKNHIASTDDISGTFGRRLALTWYQSTGSVDVPTRDCLLLWWSHCKSTNRTLTSVCLDSLRRWGVHHPTGGQRRHLLHHQQRKGNSPAQPLLSPCDRFPH